MTDNKPAERDVTKDWQASQSQKSSAFNLRIMAAVSWLIAIAGEIYAVIQVLQGKFSAATQGANLQLLVGLLIGIAVFAIIGNFLWKRANENDPASKADKARFFFQNQLGAIITLIAFLPLLLLILTDKNMDPRTKKVASGVGAVLAVIATLIGVSIKPPSIEDYTKTMNECATQIKSGQPTTACSPEVAAQAQDIARDTGAITAATKTAENPGGQDKVYWIAPAAGADEIRHRARLPSLPKCQPAQGQDGKQRHRDRGLCAERHPHHQADRDGTEAVRHHPGSHAVVSGRDT